MFKCLASCLFSVRNKLSRKKISLASLIIFLMSYQLHAFAYTYYHRHLETDLHPKTSASSISFVTSVSQGLVGFINKTVDSLRYTSYKLGGRQVDASRGIYITDCSNYVDYALQTVYPNAYGNLVNATGADNPTSQHYYDFFSGLTRDDNSYWNRVSGVKDLRAGDILVFRYKRGLRRFSGGHVMVVMDKPVAYANTYWVRVADSAPSGHSHDTRARRDSGIGIGTLLLKVNPKTGQPSAFAWKVGARWKSNVNIAMGRPSKD